MRFRWLFMIWLGLAVGSNALAAEVQVDKSSDVLRFDIQRYQVEGDILLSPDRIADLLKPFTGPRKNFGDVAQAREALEEAYRKMGYNLVQVALPEQELNHGIVRFTVISPILKTVSISGQRHFDEDNIRHSMPSLKMGVAPNIGDISENLRAVNDNPAKKIKLQFKSAENEAEVNASIAVQDQAPHIFSVWLDSTGTDQTGRERLGFLYQNSNLFNRDNVLTLQYITSPQEPGNVGIYGGGYHIPLYELGDSLDFFAGYSDVDSGTLSAGIFNLAVSGKGTMLGTRYNQNLRRSGNYAPKLIYGLDYRAYENDIGLQGIPLGNDITVHPVSVTYSGIWGLTASESGFYFTLLQNIPGGKNGSSEDFELARFGASASYSLLRYGANLVYAFSNDWQFRVAANGQYTRDLLITGEQFGIGGMSTVRGFLEREVADDNGIVGNLEIYTPNFCGSIGWDGLQCRALAFVDAGKVTRNQPLPGELPGSSIGSVGIGARLAKGRNASLLLDYARVTNAGGTESKGDNRLDFRLVVTY